MSDNREVHRYKIRLIQTRETVLECFAKDEKEAKAVAAHAAEVRLFREVKWDEPKYKYEFISESPCIFTGVVPSFWAEWARDKKREGYPYKAILKGLKEHYTGFKEDVNKIIDAVWKYDEETSERFIPNVVKMEQKDNQTFEHAANLVSVMLEVSQEEAEKILDKYWIDDEHPLDDRWDYGNMGSYMNFWM